MLLGVIVKTAVLLPPLEDNTVVSVVAMVVRDAVIWSLAEEAADADSDVLSPRIPVTSDEG